jgi:hypothetical protein
MSGFDLKRRLRSVGYFVYDKYFDLFSDYAKGRISRADCIDRLIQYGVSNPGGAKRRIGNVKPIFDANMEQEAREIARASLRKKAKSRPF